MRLLVIFAAFVLPNCEGLSCQSCNYITELVVKIPDYPQLEDSIRNVYKQYGWTGEAARHCSLRTESDYMNSRSATTLTCPSNPLGGNREPICSTGDMRVQVSYKITSGTTTVQMTLAMRNQFRGCSYFHTDINRQYGCHPASDYNDFVEGLVNSLTSGVKADVQYTGYVCLCQGSDCNKALPEEIPAIGSWNKAPSVTTSKNQLFILLIATFLFFI